jgi:hypothetical protein
MRECTDGVSIENSVFGSTSTDEDISISEQVLPRAAVSKATFWILLSDNQRDIQDLGRSNHAVCRRDEMRECSHSVAEASL